MSKASVLKCAADVPSCYGLFHVKNPPSLAHLVELAQLYKLAQLVEPAHVRTRCQSTSETSEISRRKPQTKRERLKATIGNRAEINGVKAMRVTCRMVARGTLVLK